MIKAIETRYAGCHFRSRLEARWAVAFDHLGIAWEYEPEGFETSVGRYLPDFRISAENPALSGITWIEVKPPNYPYDPRHQAFADESGERLIVVAGMCRNYRQQYSGAPLIEYGWSREYGVPRPISLYVTPHGGALILYTSDGPDSCPAIDRAYAAARSARFGHGEVAPPYRKVECTCGADSPAGHRKGHLCFCSDQFAGRPW